ncbi:YlmC/YmxH family sporulation protein [Paenibacillus sp. HN-1]|uniref:YlmC/YmxH family sporulation protein n=1 Tax=Paenibacillus TaxID=44249 RepID=UPI001CA957E8|nr:MULTISPECIES: YlmC/YmxH family sporulation protein [Paenibacillus]MBY9076975.1 YlmC/YmxH family sporulation protein [Paenibacillus sp. CGMCC 1.18879]MBY9086240.1 YlmC/YmxH family sporulation protein [Paenibacillus sinensis]
MNQETTSGGKKMRISDFQAKDVINVVDGRRLGQISDLELDLRRGVIEAIVVPGYTRFLGLFGGGADLVIPWRNIVKIGSDVVLVKMEEPRPLQETEDREILVLQREDRNERSERNERNERRAY